MEVDNIDNQTNSLLDDFFIDNNNEEVKDKIVEIPISQISDFKNHPFKVKEDDELLKLAKSVKEHGVLVPTIIRSNNDGTYEMISGHRRMKASEIAKLKKIPCIIKELTDDEATVIMVDSNLQREKILPSEKAFAYKMKMEALNRQGRRSDLTLYPLETKLDSAKKIGKDKNDSRVQVYRYIRLTNLIPKILELVDNEIIAFRPAVELSYLKEKEQEYLLSLIEYNDITPSLSQSIKLKELSQQNNLTEDKIEKIFSEEKPNQIPKIKVSRRKLQNVLPNNLKNEMEIENYIINAVIDFSNRQKNRSRMER